MKTTIISIGAFVNVMLEKCLFCCKSLISIPSLKLLILRVNMFSDWGAFLQNHIAAQLISIDQRLFDAWLFT